MVAKVRPFKEDKVSDIGAKTGREMEMEVGMSGQRDIRHYMLLASISVVSV